MKRKLFSVLLVLMLCLSMAIPVSAENTNFVYDEAGLLSAEEVSKLESEFGRISDTYDAQVVIVTMDSAGSRSIYRLDDEVYDGMEFGYGPNRDGVMILVCMDIREYRILSNGYAGDAIDEDVIESICDAIEPDLADGNYAEAFDEFADQCEYYLDGHINGFPFELGKNLLIALGIGIVVGLIVVLILKGQLKSVRKQELAHNYIKSGSMNIRISNDLLLYRTVSRSLRVTDDDDSDSSSGSSRRSGGGSF